MTNLKNRIIAYFEKKVHKAHIRYRPIYTSRLYRTLFSFIMFAGIIAHLPMAWNVTFKDSITGIAVGTYATLSIVYIFVRLHGDETKDWRLHIVGTIGTIESLYIAIIAIARGNSFFGLSLY